MSGFYYGQEPFGGQGFQIPPTVIGTRVLSLDVDLEEGVTAGVITSPRSVTVTAHSATLTLPNVATSVTLPTVAKSLTLSTRNTSVTLPSRSTGVHDPDWLTSL